MMRQCVPVASTVASASAQLFRSAVRSQFCQPDQYLRERLLAGN